MYQVKTDIISEKEFETAIQVVRDSDLKVRKTPFIKVSKDRNENKSQYAGLFDDVHQDYPNLFKKVPESMQLFLKLENCQTTGSFKIRGVASQLHAAKRILAKQGIHDMKELKLITMSAGNYGKAFAYASHKLGLKFCTVAMPNTAPQNRKRLIESFGVAVEMVPSANLSMHVKQHEKNGAIYLHPFDDLHLIAGYGSLGADILDDFMKCGEKSFPDIVLVCCGGGGVLSGVATYIHQKTSGYTHVYGVEPETANGMFQSMNAGLAMKCPEAHSIASGLAPPFAGENAYNHVQKFVRGIILISEDEIKATVSTAFQRGLVVEPAGTAALAAILTGKLLEHEPELDEKIVVAVLTGGNVSPDELKNIV